MDASQILQGLSEPEGLPVAAIRAAQADRDVMTRVFLDLLDGFLAQDDKTNPPRALFFIFHLLGEWREQAAYRPLARLLRLPPDTVDAVLGDAITMTAHRVMAAVFDGDPEPLHGIILDPNADQFVRAKMCQALVMLALRGGLSRAEVARFLRDCEPHIEPRTDSYIWCGWVDAIAWLGLEELKSLVERTFARGAIDSSFFSFKDFEKDLQHAVTHPDEPILHPDDGIELFGDTVTEFSTWYFARPKVPVDDVDEQIWPLIEYGESERNPLRNIGRNDPCPCGSGKKFKKCCLNVDRDEPRNYLRAS